MMRLSQCAAGRIELLEDRLLWSVTQNAQGWTVVSNPASPIIYVDNVAGSNSNSGLSASAPVATIGEAMALAKSDGADEILLKSGDTFVQSSTNSTATNGMGSWTLSGQSATDPFLLSYYGTGALPLIYAGTAGVSLEFAPNTSVNYVDVIGLNFDANQRDPVLQASLGTTVNTTINYEDKGFEIQGPASNILLEDDTFNYYGNNGGDNLDVEGNDGVVSNITIRRCVVDNAYDFNAGKCEGMYVNNVSNISILQSTFDHDGWNSAYLYLGGEDIGYNHDVYLSSTCSGVVIQQSTFAEAAYAGIMARSGGQIDDNLFLDDAVAVSYGSSSSTLSTIGGVTGSLIGNVMVGDKAQGIIYYNTSQGAYAIGSGLAFGQGFVIANTSASSTTLVEDNIFTQDSQNAKPAITLTMAPDTTNPSQAVGINNLTIEGNIFDGWRWGIQTDGRFVPGGTGLYALNNLVVSHNDFINNSTAEIRHDGAFSSAEESWSADRFYDSILSASNWISLQSNPLPFATWQSIYDIGATVLSTLPYTNPNVTVGTYDTTLGGPGTYQDFLANADAMSINNYQPIYMAAAAVNYIQAGFNVTAPVITTGGATSSGSTVPPTAVAEASDLNLSAIGSSSYTFTVNYTDANFLRTASLSSGNLLVFGPDGFSENATFVSAASPTTDSAGYQHTLVTYSIVPPSSAWAKGQDGTYTIDMLSNEVTDSAGNTVAPGVIGSFVADFSSPAAVATVTNLGSIASTSNSYTFSVTYSSAWGIDATTMSSYNVQVTGPGNYAKYASLTTYSPNTNGSVTATYSIPAPGSSWTAGTYTVTMLPYSVYDLIGNPVATAVLATFSSSTTNTGTASISGTVFNDALGTGVFNSRDNVLTGVTVFIDPSGTGVYSSGDTQTTTDANGNYSFGSLAAGSYSVVEVAPTGFTVTTPVTDSNIVTLTTGKAATGVNFANQVGSAVLSSNSGSKIGGSKTGGSTSTGSTNTSTGTTTIKSSSGSSSKGGSPNSSKGNNNPVGFGNQKSQGR
jgi:hypothetical protein